MWMGSLHLEDILNRGVVKEVWRRTCHELLVSGRFEKQVNKQLGLRKKVERQALRTQFSLSKYIRACLEA